MARRVLIATVLAAAFLLTTIGTNGVMGAALSILPGDQQSTAQSAQLAATPSVRTLNVGVSGAITGEPLKVDLTGDGDTEILLPTSAGLYAVSYTHLTLPTTYPV